jgi:UDP-hydrolysing UDP-N-acetyl-D-glucosamine 2-epimerase
MKGNQKKICVVTGSRAEYGLLYGIMKKIQEDEDLLLQLVVTGMHLSPEFGLTYREIEKDGFPIAEKVEMLLSSDTPAGIGKSVGLGVIGFADALDRLDPDLLILLGDRFEILAAAQAALFARIPVAHIAGGDTTEGAFDEAIRHSITKMSHLHFPTNEQAVKRILQLGEHPDYIYNFGSPGIDYIKHLTLLTREELEDALGVRFLDKNILVTFHPVTLEASSPAQFGQLLEALTFFEPHRGIFITKANADTEGRIINNMADELAARKANVHTFTSLGQLRYLSLISEVDVVVGNSSSGLYEVPTFKKPTINIGDRQKGRLAASSVIHCRPVTEDIIAAIQMADTLDCSQVQNPYGEGNSAARIVATIKKISDLRNLLKKHFFMMES